MLAMLEGIDSCDAAEALKKQTIWIDAAEVEVDEDEYLWDELTGYKVVTSDGLLLGVVDGLVEFGAQDNLCVTTTGESTYANGQSGEWMLPFIEDVVMSIDDENEIIEVELPEGMDACFTPRS
jgi:16S rRNA processing protein RimM